MDQPEPERAAAAPGQALLAMTIGQAFDATVAHPDGEALVVRHQRLRYTWRQLAEVDLHARALLALGMQTGDRLGIWVPTAPSGASARWPAPSSA
jgi:fatty-acyl-CoA synthase